MTLKTVLSLGVALAAGATAMGQSKDEPKKDDIKPMTIGDSARPIDIEHWVKGDKIAKFQSGKVYVLEFWATWCGPCRMSMPHITGLQQQYKDYGVTFIGVSDEKLETVTDFLAKSDTTDGDKKWSDKIGYTLTTDPDKSVYNDYFKAAGQNGIPCAFIIGKDQHIEWIGHPMGIDKPLDSVVKDSWDRKSFKEQWEKQEAAERESSQSQMELGKAMRAKDWPKAVSLLDAMIAKNDKLMSAKVQKFQIMLGKMNDPAKAYPYGEEIAKAAWNDSMTLNMLAWFVVDDKDVQKRDLDFAMKLAARANEVSGEKEAAILDTLARVHYEKGDLKKAVEIEREAVANVAPGPMGESLKASLKKYEEELAKKSS